MKTTFRSTKPHPKLETRSPEPRSWSALASALAALHKRIVPGLRVSAYLAGLAWLASAFWIREARGALSEASLSLGRQLSEVADSLVDAKEVELNGQRLLIATRKVTGSVREVLERFDGACRAHAGQLSGVARHHGIDQLQQQRLAGWSHPLVRSENAREGVLGCLVGLGGGAKVGSLSDAFESFLESRDAAVFGTFLVVYVKAHERSAQLVVAWNPGSFRVLDLFPETGDAPGSDSPRLGRPDGARRILSGTAPGEPYGLFVYESMQSPNALLETFSVGLARRGWSQLPQSAPPDARAFIHESGVLALASAKSASGKTLLSLCEMGAGSPPSPAIGRQP